MNPANFGRALQTMSMAFQPIVRASDQRIFRYEALMRSSEESLPHPGAILGATERLDRLDDLGRRVRDLSAEAFERAPDEAFLFVNLHPRDLLDPTLYEPSSLRQRLVGSMASVCKEMTMRVVAEGVELREEFAIVVEAGCDLLQGYLFARPGPPFPEPSRVT